MFVLEGDGSSPAQASEKYLYRWPKEFGSKEFGFQLGSEEWKGRGGGKGPLRTQGGG